MARIQQYDTLTAMLARLDGSRASDGAWIRYQPHQGSLDSFSELPPLQTCIDQARTLAGLNDACASVERLTDQLVGELPPPTRITRQRTRGRSGYAVNPHAVLRGQLDRAWKRTERKARPAAHTLAVLVPVSWSSGIRDAQILWSAAASLALARLAVEAGYSVEVWAVLASTGKWQSGERDNLTLVCLKAGYAPWNVQGMALSTQPQFLRRLGFRLWETYTPENGPLTRGYGSPMPAWQLAPLLAPLFPSTVTVVLGADQDTRVTNEATALAWCQAQLQQIDAA